MFELNKLVRSNILSLQPYSSARDEFQGKEGVFLDANENPFGELNRYPDPHQIELKTELSKLKSVALDSIFIGNGSDEIIDLAFRIFCAPEKDNVIICPPTYGMYEVSANVNDVRVISIPLVENFQLNIEEILQTDAKIVFICSPNNPTGNTINNIERLLEKFNGLVFLDEAYIDFSSQISYVTLLNKYPNLLISQTLSKAWGLAAARIGILYASKEIIALFKKVKPPYNVSLPNQQAAITALRNVKDFEKNVAEIKIQKSELITALNNLQIVKTIFPSDANFVLVEFDNASAIYKLLVSKQIITRNRSSLIHNCIRITVGTAQENNKLINELNLINEKGTFY